MASCNENTYELNQKRAEAEKKYKDAVVNKADKLEINALKFDFEMAKIALGKVKGDMELAKTVIDANRSLLKWYRVELGVS
jgi:hypothetical protein